MELTGKGRAVLEAYLAEVRRSLAGRIDVDADDVVAGLREHVDAELSARQAGHATVEEVMGVLERLGTPTAWVASGMAGTAQPGGESPFGNGDVPQARTGLAAARVGLVLAGLGLALVLMGVWTMLGWALLAAGIVGARLGVVDEAGAPLLEVRLTRLLWQGSAGALVLLLVLGPVVLVWSQAQIGGVLEGWLSARVAVHGTGRPAVYWLATSAVAAAVTGVWWLLLGLLVRRFRAAMRRILAPPAAWLVPASSSRRLLVGGLLLLVFSVLGWLL